jgi:hypothetical protein
MPRAKKSTQRSEHPFDKIAYVIPALPGVRTCPFCKERPHIEVHVDATGVAFCAVLLCSGCFMAGPLPVYSDPTGPLAASRAVDQWNGMLDGTPNVWGPRSKPADVPARDDL